MVPLNCASGAKSVIVDCLCLGSEELTSTMMCVDSENAVAGGDALLYRYIVREIGQTLTCTVDACRVGLVACK